MDFTKFVSLLDSRALYFARVDKLGDPFEGTYPQSNADAVKLAKEQLSRDSGDSEPLEDRQKKIKILENNEKMFLWAADVLRKSCFVNCWHQSEHESAAMWSLYLKSDEGIAIQSTVDRLAKSLSTCPLEIYIGKLKYIDYNKIQIPVDNGLKFLVHKRLSYSHERELRAVLWLRPTQAEDKLVIQSWIEGVEVEADIEKMIEKVYVSPSAPDWFLSLVKSIVERYGFDIHVERSFLADSPLS